MSLILSIDTSTPVCSVALHEEGNLVAIQTYNLGKSHSSLLPAIIAQVLDNVGYDKKALKAVSVCAGPGSYTGLRIGASVAKGLCYALEIPLIAINSLALISASVFRLYPQCKQVISSLDARRSEVYTEVVTRNSELMKPTAVVLDTTAYQGIDLLEEPVYVAGDGALKINDLVSFDEELILLPFIMPNAEELGIQSYNQYRSENFEEVAYFEPFYLKEFYTTQKIK